VTKKRRLGVLTSGGDCPGLNAVIRAITKRGVTELGWEVVGIRNSFNGLLTTPFDVVSLSRDSVRGILTRGGTILGTTNRGNPFRFPMKNADGSTAHVDRSAEIVESLRILELEGLIVIGGDGSLRIAKQFMDRGVKIIAVPKTIDNDIAATDYTFGFQTAVQVATDAVDRLHSTAESHDRVMVIEVMGRDAGWIALHSGVSGGADAILIPEIPYDIQKVCDKVRRRQAAGRLFSIIVVAEGAYAQGEKPMYMSEGRADGGMPRLGGAGSYVANLISERTGLETRVTVLGHLLRGGTPSSYDRLLATRFGAAAMGLADSNLWGQMVALRGMTITNVSIEEAVGKQKLVDPDGELIATARQLGIEFG
jgi:ATP-dependent phosphofructokinase / diphosphate-dependent phosphofructokinase